MNGNKFRIERLYFSSIDFRLSGLTHKSAAVFAVAYAQRQTMNLEHLVVFAIKVAFITVLKAVRKKTLLPRCLLLSTARINFPLWRINCQTAWLKGIFQKHAKGDEKALTIVIN